MNIVEEKIMECWSTGNALLGHISLDSLAVPGTVKVTLLGEPIAPVSFDIFGHPNFTQEQYNLYALIKAAYNRQNGNNQAQLKAEISYKERAFDVPKSDFDTVKGIRNSLRNLAALNEMLQNRKIFCKAHRNEPLNMFMLFGYFLLDQSGRVMSVEKSVKGKLVSSGDVESYEHFVKRNDKVAALTFGGYDIPTPGSVCPCCGKTFTIGDIKSNPCVYIGGKLYHESCWRNYRQVIEVDKFTNRLLSRIYNESDYKFVLLPNGYRTDGSYSYIPWFRFHTIDGDIVMGCRKRIASIAWLGKESHIIAIEWQENYKPFDMGTLFGTENAHKWEEGGRRGIYASGEDKAYEYLKKVLEAVNPGYSKR